MINSSTEEDWSYDSILFYIRCYLRSLQAWLFFCLISAARIITSDQDERN